LIRPDRRKNDLSTSGGGELTVTAELLFQSIGYRWSQNITAVDSPEGKELSGYLAATPNQPVVITQAKETAK
jgi:hypothetical protein